ncbi:hypothetical protein RA280_16445 [Cupriavidus sp. CV2]|uniref:hypothetical protein n=1 Tax=Cupriavidus ulmosensis TaxID=3065913 RepID=UPI00296AF3E5|nr:hypothetical protein [Cupriavidus sp. CV2]MDW3683312.1 hypothetical protein [Cupriavidus sp. CV2]
MFDTKAETQAWAETRDRNALEKLNAEWADAIVWLTERAISRCPARSRTTACGRSILETIFGVKVNLADIA